MNSTEQKRLRAKVHEALLFFYESKGFKLSKTNGVFKKDGFEVEWGVSAKNIDYIYFNPSLCVVEDIVQNTLQLVFEEKKFGLTICRLAGCRLAQEFGVHEYDYLGDNEDDVDNGTTYKVDQESDLSKLVADHVNYMEKVGLPFFEKVNSLQGIYKYLSDLFFKNEKVKKIIGKREVLSCVAASYLLNDSDIEKLLRRLEELYAGNTYLLDDMQKIKQYFENKGSPHWS
ncbi:hypothetical protein SanaruYs_06690 [Chryseotalea sanaruensis]|uniref:DUF4304 domain-containing protein n=1 Tax=Chryseotalea sanaruensis TaxID=2482724 RepID=A0A401U670_9BACT|nr:response regulator transcription factor [Chryseotalea sanaruensis]GCC50454.1 hypothetical protein SanaruYs_06690 [Chryseotalea sanaruensis]